MKADVNVIGSNNQIVRQLRRADGAEYDFVRAQRREDFRRPPARMAKFQDVSIGGIELRQNQFKSRRSEFEIRRQLKQKAAQLWTEHVGNLIKFTDQILCALKAFLVRDGAIDFDGVAKVLRCITFPIFNGRQLGRAIKRRIKLDGIELLRVMIEPVMRRQIIRIKCTLPFPIIPA